MLATVQVAGETAHWGGRKKRRNWVRFSFMWPGPYLNPDLSGRVSEVPIVWNEADLDEIFIRGGQALNLEFSEDIRSSAIADCFGNAGILQRLILGSLDQLDVDQGMEDTLAVDGSDALEAASMLYAEELNPLYQLFAKRVSKGIRNRQDSTGIYAHAMAVIMEQPDEDLIRGVSIGKIFNRAHEREARIQKGNLHTVLEKVEGLQVDDDGRGLVIAYNEADREVSVVDRQLLLYRKYSTVTWPWEDLVREAEEGTVTEG